MRYLFFLSLIGLSFLFGDESSEQKNLIAIYPEIDTFLKRALAESVPDYWICDCEADLAIESSFSYEQDPEISLKVRAKPSFERGFSNLDSNLPPNAQVGCRYVRCIPDGGGLAVKICYTLPEDEKIFDCLLLAGFFQLPQKAKSDQRLLIKCFFTIRYPASKKALGEELVEKLLCYLLDL